MLQYVIAGLVLGGIYAIASSGLVVTYVSSGIMNFSFAAIAFFIARLYYFLLVEESWGIVLSAIVSILIVGPAIGVALYFVLFRHLRLSSPLIKVVATLGLLVSIPALATLAFGSGAILKAPGLAPEPVHVFNVIGVAVTLDQLIVYLCVIAIVALGAVVLRRTDVGLKVRAMVDSPAMTELSGTNPGRISVGVWAVSMMLAGLSGVLAAPIIGLDPANFTLLVAAAFAAVVAARLRSLPIAVGVSLAMGVTTSLIQYALPPSSHWTSEVLDAVPFMFIAVFVVYHLLRHRDLSESQKVGGALDGAITPQGESQLAGSTDGTLEGGSLGFIARYGGPLALIALAALLPVVVPALWVNPLMMAFAYAIIFLSFTLVTGEGGMIWLCEITFAGIGGLTAAQLAANHHWPVLLAILAGGLITLPIGLFVGFLTIRLGGLYVALITLTFGLLVENLVFTWGMFQNGGLGVNVNRPAFANSDLAFAYVCLAAFGIVALFIMNLRRSTTGLALSAVRWSEPGSRTLGISVVQMKIIVAGIAAMVAGIGGGFLVTAQTSALPGNFSTFLGVVWLAVLVTFGVRSNAAALVAGIAFAMPPFLVLYYHLPQWMVQVPTLLFGLGAIGVAKFPNGTVAQVGELFRRWLLRRVPSHGAPPTPSAAAPAVEPRPAAEVGA